MATTAPNDAATRPPAVSDAHVATHQVTTASTAHSSRVHLVDTGVLRRTLCNVEIARLSPPDHIWTRACSECVGRALRAGITVAGERNTLINLQRVPSTGS